MTITAAQIKISAAEFRTRADALQAYLRESGLHGVVLFDADYLKYYSGFAFIPTERPMAFVMNADGERGLFVPRLEAEHAKANAAVDRVDYYLEYPGGVHPMGVLADMLKAMGISERMGVDTDGYPWIFGYRGAPISEVSGVAAVQVRAFIEDQMMIKSPAEIALLKESCKWANLAHRLLQRYTRPGVTETEVERRAANEATDAMLDALGPIYKGQSSYYGGAVAGYRGQIGRNAAIPHALAANITFQAGDVLVTGASAPVWGYVSELERTMVLGEPTQDQRTLFDHMLNLQDIALDAIKPGVSCSDVDKAVRRYFETNDLMPLWKHHTGHAIGLRYHEAPFLDTGDDTIIRPGMVFTVEPGVYQAGIGGFRHSDTVLVTDSGIEMLTFYPRDLENLTLPI
ncbi:MAG TPA: Xaa-Pro peptidase family protein [Aggregatilineales bacterium]|nr:Xaa-Pro peptidase family protein [Aggregatilineales bacterium]